MKLFDNTLRRLFMEKEKWFSSYSKKRRSNLWRRISKFFCRKKTQKLWMCIRFLTINLIGTNLVKQFYFKLYFVIILSSTRSPNKKI